MIKCVGREDQIEKETKGKSKGKGDEFACTYVRGMHRELSASALVLIP